MNVLILGAGDNSRELYFHLLDICKQDSEQLNAIFIDDNPNLKNHILKDTEVPIITDWSIPDDFSNFIVGASSPRAKQALVSKALSLGLIPLATQIHPSATIQDAKIGLGGMVAPNATITTNVTIGNYVSINYNATIGHDSILQDYVSIHPGANISGNVTLKEGVLVGAGAAIKEGVSIEMGCTVGMKSAIVKDITDANQTYIGVPGEPLKK